MVIVFDGDHRKSDPSHCKAKNSGLPNFGGTNLKIAFGRLFGWKEGLATWFQCVWYSERCEREAYCYSYNYDHKPQNLTDESYSWADCKYRAEET